MKIIQFTLPVLLLFVLISCSASNNISSSQNYDSLKIGIMLPLKATNPIDGYSHQTIAQYAIDQFNKDLSSKDKIYLKFKDHNNNVDQGITCLEEFEKENMKIVVGANISSNVFILMEYIENLIFINTTSTLNSLDEDDNLFRLVPNDLSTAKILAQFYINQGIKKLAILYRNDIWANELNLLVQQEFENLGGEILTAQRYEIYASTEDYDSLLSNIENTILSVNSPSNEIGIELISLDEGSDIIHIASQYSNICNVKWFGCDGIAQNTDLTVNELNSITSKISLWSPVLGEPNDDNYNNIKEEIADLLGYEPKAIDMIMYDAILSAATSLSNMENLNSNITTYKNNYSMTLDDFEGISGLITMDENGDRESTNYDIWGLVDEDGTIVWKRQYCIKYNTITESE